MKCKALERGVWISLRAPGKVSEILKFDMFCLNKFGDCAQVKTTGGPHGIYAAFIPEGIWPEYEKFFKEQGLKETLLGGVHRE